MRAELGMTINQENAYLDGLDLINWPPTVYQVKVSSAEYQSTWMPFCLGAHMPTQPKVSCFQERIEKQEGTICLVICILILDLAG